MNNWNNLSIKEKADFIRSAVANGITDLGKIKRLFETDFANVQNSQAPFVDRLRNNDTRSIVNEDGTISTHKLGYVTGDDGAYIYPEVQEGLDGQLETGNWNSAYNKGDYIKVSQPFAEFYSKNYKRYYPEFFNRFEKSGNLYPLGGYVGIANLNDIQNRFDGESRSNWMERVKGNLELPEYSGNIGTIMETNYIPETQIAFKSVDNSNNEVVKEKGDSIRKIIPKGLLIKLAQAADVYGFSNQNMLGSFVASNNKVRSIGDIFLFDRDRQTKEAKKLGYHLVEDNDYGRVNNATKQLIKATGKHVPIYQLGEDAVPRENLEILAYKLNNNSVPSFGDVLSNAANYPYNIYRDAKTNKYYYRAWDLNDYGDYGSAGITYGKKQRLTKLYDRLGNPFVQRTAITEIPEWEGKHYLIKDTGLDLSISAFKKSDAYPSADEIDNKKSFYGNEYILETYLPSAYQSWLRKQLSPIMIPEYFSTKGLKNNWFTDFPYVPFTEYKKGGNLHDLESYNNEETVPNDTTTIRAFTLQPQTVEEPVQTQRIPFALNNKFGRLEFYINTNEDIEATKQFYLQNFYKTAVKNNDFETLYKSGQYNYSKYMNDTADLDIGKTVYNNLSELTTIQRLAALANSYHESEGWVKDEQTNGPAKGLFMFESGTRTAYEKWLKDNKYTASNEKEIEYVQHLFTSKDKSLKTPWDKLDEVSVLKAINDKREKNKQTKFKDSEELKEWIRNNSLSDASKLGTAAKVAWQHQDYTTKQAFKDWKSNDLSLAIKAFEALFERAGRPQMEKRYGVGKILNKALELGWFNSQENANKEDNLMD